LDGGAGWLAVVVALNAVVGLAYYVRAAMVPFQPADGLPAEGAVERAEASVAGRPVALPVVVGVVLAAVTLAALVVGVAPQLVLDAVTAPLQ
jgi:NADH-quinone oxidoreductase subunit N